MSFAASAVQVFAFIMLLAGLASLITGRLPTKLLGLMFGYGDYVAKPKQARLFGLLLISPIPLTLGFGTLFLSAVSVLDIRLIYPENGVLLINMIITAVVAIRATRKARHQFKFAPDKYWNRDYLDTDWNPTKRRKNTTLA